MAALLMGGCVSCVMGNPAFDPAVDDGGDPQTGGGQGDDVDPAQNETGDFGAGDTDAGETGSRGDDGVAADLPDKPPPAHSPDPCADNEPDLVACYDFDELMGGNAADGSGNDNDVMLEGASLTAGIDGKALLLDASSRAAAADSSSLKFDGAVSVELWVRVDSANADAGLIHKQSQFGLVRLADGTLDCKRAGGSVQGGHLPIGVWTEVACIFDGTALTIEIDRVEVAREWVANPPGAFNDKPMMIGSKSPDFTARLSGAVDAVRISKGAR